MWRWYEKLSLGTALAIAIGCAIMAIRTYKQGFKKPMGDLTAKRGSAPIVLRARSSAA